MYRIVVGMVEFLINLKQPYNKNNNNILEDGIKNVITHK